MGKKCRIKSARAKTRNEKVAVASVTRYSKKSKSASEPFAAREGLEGSVPISAVGLQEKVKIAAKKKE